MFSVFVLLLWAGALDLFFGISFDAISVALLGLSLVMIGGVLTFGEGFSQKSCLEYFGMVFSSCNDGNFTWKTWRNFYYDIFKPCFFIYTLFLWLLLFLKPGYVSFKKWWSIGFVISIVDIVVMITVGFVW